MNQFINSTLDEYKIPYVLPAIEQLYELETEDGEQTFGFIIIPFRKSMSLETIAKKGYSF